MALAAASSKKKYAEQPGTVRTYTLDTSLPNTVRDQVLAALATEQDPTKLEAFAAAIAPTYPLSASALRQKAAMLRAGTLPKNPVDLLTQVPDPIRTQVMQQLMLQNDPNALEAYATQLASQYPAAAAALRMKEAVLRGQAPEVAPPAPGAMPTPPVAAAPVSPPIAAPITPAPFPSTPEIVIPPIPFPSIIAPAPSVNPPAAPVPSFPTDPTINPVVPVTPSAPALAATFHCGLSPRGAHLQLKALAKCGHLVHEPGTRRAYRARVERPASAVPIVGRVPAGHPSEQPENHEGTLPLPWPVGDHVFAVRITGDSMKNAHVISGDLVVVDRKRQPKKGDIVVAAIDGGHTIKRFHPKKTKWILEAANAKYNDVTPRIEGDEIVGCAVALVRRI